MVMCFSIYVDKGRREGEESFDLVVRRHDHRVFASMYIGTTDKA